MDPNVHEAFDRLKQQGKARFLGFSTHTPNLVQVANPAIDSGRFDVMMLAYHHGLWPPLPEIIERARREQDMGVVAMKTLKGAKHHGLVGLPRGGRRLLPGGAQVGALESERLLRRDLVLRAPARGRVPVRLGTAADAPPRSPSSRSTTS